MRCIFASNIINVSLLDYFKYNRINNVQVVNYENDYDIEKIGTIEIPDRLTDLNAFTLANTVSEIYFPIDFLADRASKLRFYIADKNGNEIAETELNRFLNEINPLYSFSDLFYQAIFSLLSDGNIISYIQFPKSYKKPSINTISRVDILQPDMVDIREYTNISPLKVITLNDYIISAKLMQVTGLSDNLIAENLRINNYDTTRKECSFILSKSPLFKSYRNINTLLAVYSARYNVYRNNGAGGYLVKKSSGKENDVQDAIDPITRDKILADINVRNGVTGNRNLWGISSVPIEFVNTLVSIKELMPFEETFEDAVKIAGNYQIKSTLLPRKDHSTFDNEETAERSVWENTLISLIENVLFYFTKNFTLDKAGYKIKADYSSVSCLNKNDKEIQDIISVKLANLEKIKIMTPSTSTDVDKEIKKIMDSYGK